MSINRSLYSSDISLFLQSDSDAIIGSMVMDSGFADEPNQKGAWEEEILHLQEILHNQNGRIYFEYAIPRMGKRIDVLLIIEHVVFVLEFKVGERVFHEQAIEQVWDYALDLKNFHSTSHEVIIAPLLVCTQALPKLTDNSIMMSADKVLRPLRCNQGSLRTAINSVLNDVQGQIVDINNWESGIYKPTPTIVEAATALYKGHTVEDITRHGAEAKNLSDTTKIINEVIEYSKQENRKSICFVTGVPGAGKTLVGLKVATEHMDQDNELYSVYLSGNGPLVAVLREALTRDKVQYEKQNNRKVKKGEVSGKVKMFIQNVHHFRDEYVRDTIRAPIDHVALFDEAQRAWNAEMTADFMRRKKRIPNFTLSEPEFLISCLDRHKDWATIVCLVGGGQEINRGEAGISEWLQSLHRSFPHWDVYISPNLKDSEYEAGNAVVEYKSVGNLYEKGELHLAVSLRSFRAKNVSSLVKKLLDIDLDFAKMDFDILKDNYHIALTRNLSKAKAWLREKAQGSQRYGLLSSSQAERLKPDAICVKAAVNPIHWFLNDKYDVRSSFFLEDVATEFMVQGLELDWTCVAWDADFRYTPFGWQNYYFHGNMWKNIRADKRKTYQKNAYRVLLTRARQGMVIYIPEGNPRDHTRKPEFYDGTFAYLQSIGFETI